MCAKSLDLADILAVGGISCDVMGVSCPNALPGELVDHLRDFRCVVTYEDHDRETGLGASVALAMSHAGEMPPLLRFGVHEYGMSGEADELYTIQGLQPEQVAEDVIAFLRG